MSVRELPAARGPGHGSNHQTVLSHKSRLDIHDRYTASKCSSLDHNVLFWFFKQSFYLCLVQSVTAATVTDHFNGKTGNIIQTFHTPTIPPHISIVISLFSYRLTTKTWRKCPNPKGLNIDLESALQHQLCILYQRLTTCSQNAAFWISHPDTRKHSRSELLCARQIM